MSTTYYEKPKRLEKLSKKDQLSLFFDLINAFSKVKNPIDTTLLLQDLLTTKEIRNLSKRLRIAKLILEGNTQKEIVKKLHCSYATVTKVSIWLSQSGYRLRKVISKLPKVYKFPKNLPRGPIEFHLPQTLLALTQYGLAKKQRDKLKRFTDELKGKEKLDKGLREKFSEKYKEKHRRRRRNSAKDGLKTN